MIPLLSPIDLAVSDKYPSVSVTPCVVYMDVFAYFCINVFSYQCISRSQRLILRLGCLDVSVVYHKVAWISHIFVCLGIFIPFVHSHGKE